MDRIWLFSLLLVLSMSPLAAQDGIGTKFRGIAINMDAMEIERLPYQEVSLKSGSNKLELIRKTDKKVCAEIWLDDQRKVRELILNACFFSGDDLDLDAAAQEIVNAYGIDALSCKGGSTYLPSVRSSVKWRNCSGHLPTGELVSVTYENLGMGWKVSVARRSKGQRPSFD